ncbi:MAG: hypothetical protein ACJA1Z_002084 [Patiriisocius sp.]|jgi:hypothetical protein
MTIIEAREFFKILVRESSSRREIKIYNKFIGVLNGLENREFSSHQIEMIEKELTLLNLEQATKNRKKYLRKKLNEFIKYLESEHSLILENHYASLGMVLGLTFGVAIGLSIFRDSGGSSTGMCFGMLIGIVIGRYMDKQAAENNKVLHLN